MRHLIRWLALALTITAVGALPGAPAVAAPGDLGVEDFAWGPGQNPRSWVDPDLAPTASKPQSKVWHSHGSWWGVLRDPDSRSQHVFRLDAASEVWQDTGVQVDPRAGARVDVLWDGARLDVVAAAPSGADDAIRFSRWRLDSGSWVADPAFPVVVDRGLVEAAVLARDSTGRFWLTWTEAQRVQVAAGDADGRSWGPTFVPPVSGTTVDPDDISAVQAHNGVVTVVWSNQVDSAIYAATHRDADPDDVWEASSKAIRGPKVADDHISVKSMESDPAGRLFVVVKTSLNDVTPLNSSAPLLVLLVLRPDGTWLQTTYATVADNLTRPIVLIDTTRRLLRVFATGPVTGGTIYTKSAPLDAPTFVPGRGEPYLRIAADPYLNNATSTKQNVTAATGLLLLASDPVTGRYVHRLEPGSVAPSPPLASFTSTPGTGSASLTAQLTDTSTGQPTTWSWDFGDGTGSTEQNPAHTFTQPGTWPVTLTVTNAGGSSSTTQQVTVVAPPAPAAYSAVVLGDEPAGYWRLGDAGTTARAAAGPDGTITGGSTPTVGAITGDPDQATQLDGSSGLVSVPSTPALNPTGDLTLEAWARPTSTGGAIVHKGGASGNPVWQYRLAVTGAGQWRGTVFVGSTAYAVTAPSAVVLGRWTHVVMVRSSGVLTLYLDGLAVATAPAPGTLNTTSAILAVGRSGASTTSWFGGAADEVAVWGRALSAAEVREHYLAGSGG